MAGLGGPGICFRFDISDNQMISATSVLFYIMLELDHIRFEFTRIQNGPFPDKTGAEPALHIVLEISQIRFELT